MAKRRKIFKAIKPFLVSSALFLLIMPIKAYAKEVTDNKVPLTKKEQLLALGISVSGLKKCLDPCATPLQKAIYCSRPCCLVAAITSGCIAESTQPGSTIHKLASVCCASSWVTYAALAVASPQKLPIKSGPEL